MAFARKCGRRRHMASLPRPMFPQTSLSCADLNEEPAALAALEPPPAAARRRGHAKEAPLNRI